MEMWQAIFLDGSGRIHRVSVQEERERVVVINHDTYAKETHWTLYTRHYHEAVRFLIWKQQECLYRAEIEVKLQKRYLQKLVSERISMTSRSNGIMYLVPAGMLTLFKEMVDRQSTWTDDEKKKFDDLFDPYIAAKHTDQDSFFERDEDSKLVWKYGIPKKNGN